MNEITVASPSAQLPMKRDVDEQRLTPLVSLLWRRRWLVVGVLILSLIVSGIYAATAKRRYASTARIYVQQSGPRLMGNDRPELAMADGDQFAATQAELVRSTPVLSSAYPKLQNVPSIARSSN